MDDVMWNAYVDEMSKLAGMEKDAGIGKILSFLRKGVHQWGALGRSVKKRGIKGTAGALKSQAGMLGSQTAARQDIVSKMRRLGHGPREAQRMAERRMAEYFRRSGTAPSGYGALARKFAPAGAVGGLGLAGLYGAGKAVGSVVGD